MILTMISGNGSVTVNVSPGDTYHDLAKRHLPPRVVQDFQVWAAGVQLDPHDLVDPQYDNVVFVGPVLAGGSPDDYPPEVQ